MHGMNIKQINKVANVLYVWCNIVASSLNTVAMKKQQYVPLVVALKYMNLLTG
jgi:hypothetical protein